MVALTPKLIDGGYIVTTLSEELTWGSLPLGSSEDQLIGVTLDKEE
ncbi:MAG: hypothetical protein ACYTXC_23240 [Nostoc sp.]